MFRKLLPNHIDIVGCGGILTGLDIFEHILCGASAVQVGTFLQEHPVNETQRLLDALQSIMKEKKYSRLEDFRNKLRVTTEMEMPPVNDPAYHH